MNKFYNSFEEFHETEKHSLKKLCYFLQRNRLKTLSFDEVKVIVDYAGWLAWKHHYRKYKDKPVEFSIFTFMNYTIKAAIKELILKPSLSVSNEYIDIKFEDKRLSPENLLLENLLTQSISKLSSIEQKVIYNRFIENKTLHESALENKLSIEMIRLIQLRAIDKLKDILEYVE